MKALQRGLARAVPPMARKVERDEHGNKLPRRTRRERFLSEMDAVIPWRRLIALVEPHYPKPGNGRPPQPLETMLRIHFLQQFFNLSDPAAEDALYDSRSMARFARVKADVTGVPDESTILRFRHLLERHELGSAIFEAINAHLGERELIVRSGTIVDATLIEAPPSTKNREKARDPEMHQTRKGRQWYFGMKLHAGSDLNGIVHTLTATDAAQSDIGQLADLLHGQERELYGDQAYWSGFHRDCARASGIRYRVNRRAAPGKKLTERERQRNRLCSMRRARGEHPFGVIKHLWGFRKVRYRGIAKNLSRAKVAFGLSNLYRLRGVLLGA